MVASMPPRLLACASGQSRPHCGPPLRPGLCFPAQYFLVVVQSGQHSETSHLSLPRLIATRLLKGLKLRSYIRGGSRLAPPRSLVPLDFEREWEYIGASDLPGRCLRLPRSCGEIDRTRSLVFLSARGPFLSSIPSIPSSEGLLVPRPRFVPLERLDSSSGGFAPLRMSGAVE